jgi:hypothetical protein
MLNNFPRHVLSIGPRDLELVADPGGLMNLDLQFRVRGRVTLGSRQCRTEAAAANKPVQLPVQRRRDFALVLSTGRRYTHYCIKFATRAEPLRETIAERSLKTVYISRSDQPIRGISWCKTGAEP